MTVLQYPTYSSCYMWTKALSGTMASWPGPFDICLFSFLVERNLEVKLPTIWTDGKAEVGRVREEKKRSEKTREEKEREKKEGAGARKGRKVAAHCVFPMICGSRRPKSNLAEAAGAEPCHQMRDEKVHTVVARSTFPKS